MKASVFYENELGQMVPLLSETYIKTALDTMTEICKMTHEELADRPNTYERRAAAEEILRHYREGDFVRDIKENGLTINVNGAIPVRPKTTTELKFNQPEGVLTENTLVRVREAVLNEVENGTADTMDQAADNLIQAILRAGILFREHP